MNYTELKAQIKNVCEEEFSDDILALFVQQAEQKIFNTPKIAQLPALRKNVLGNLTSGVEYLSVPTDFLWVYSLAVISSTGEYTYLDIKEVSFIREGFPNPNYTAKPKHYAHFDQDSFIVAPTPDQAYQTELHYGHYPESIVTAGNTWLGDTFDSALLNGALIEAIRYMKGEEDIVANYEKIYLFSIQLLQDLADNKLQRDAYNPKRVMS